VVEKKEGTTAAKPCFREQRKQGESKGNPGEKGRRKNKKGGKESDKTFLSHPGERGGSGGGLRSFLEGGDGYLGKTVDWKKWSFSILGTGCRKG